VSSAIAPRTSPRSPRRYIVPAVCTAGIAIGLLNQPVARTNSATLLWLVALIGLILWTAHCGRTAMLNAADLTSGTSVHLNRSVGPKTETVEAVFLGATGSDCTVSIPGDIPPAYRVAWDHPSYWISDPKTGLAYAPRDDEPVLATTAPELE
jgi:hypothetical protein